MWAQFVVLLALWATVSGLPTETGKNELLGARPSSQSYLDQRSASPSELRILQPSNMEANVPVDPMFGQTPAPQAIDPPVPVRNTTLPSGSPVPSLPAVELESPVNTSAQRFMKETPIPDILITIPTMRRWTHERQPAPEKYLTPLVESLASSIVGPMKKHIRIMIYNVDKEPNMHTEVDALKRRFPDVIDVVVKPSKGGYNPLNPNLKKDEKILLTKTNGEVVEVSQTTMDWISGETHDVTSLLFDARKRAPFVMFLEDDVKPTSNALEKLIEYMAELKEHQIDDWFMIDLYTPNINWGRNPLYVKNFERYDYECCTQAMLFRSDHLLDLLLFEAVHPNLPLDDNIRDFAREDESSRAIYAISPNLFEHVGRYSSNPDKSSETVEHTSLNFEP